MCNIKKYRQFYPLCFYAHMKVTLSEYRHDLLY